jgi:hypothetical protein
MPKHGSTSKRREVTMIFSDEKKAKVTLKPGTKLEVI